MKIVRKVVLGESKKFFFDNYKLGDKIHVTETAKAIGVSRQAIYNWINEIKSI